MNLVNYQYMANKYATAPCRVHGRYFNIDKITPGLTYCALKLAGEAGEFSQKIGKLMRDKNSVITAADCTALMSEAGDCLWYLAQIATELGVSLETIANENLDKLSDRLSRGVIGGSGDDR